MSLEDQAEYESKFYWLDLEGDYESSFRNGWRPDPYGEAVIPVGLCTYMCTSEEMYEREVQRRLSRFEIKASSRPPKADRNLAIKEFRRSAVGSECSRALNLRPWSVLQRTLHHLLLDICLKHDDWMYICDFVFDRLKAVRQDMIIQRIEGRRYIEILEGSVRFLVYSMYRLTCTLKDYTTIQSTYKPLLTPAGTPLSGLDNYEINVVREMKLTMQCLRDCLQSLLVQYHDFVPDSPNRALFEAMNLIVNIPILPEHCLQRTDASDFIQLCSTNRVLSVVFKMYIEHLTGNHLAAMNNLPKLQEYPLIIMAYAPVIAQIQLHLVAVIKKTHASRGPSKTHPNNLTKLICPEWLDQSADERFIFTIFMAIQFGIFDEADDLISFCIKPNDVKPPARPRNFYEKAEIIRATNMATAAEHESETRAYAMQMLAARNWSFFTETLKIYGVESILDPSR